MKTSIIYVLVLMILLFCCKTGKLADIRGSQKVNSDPVKNISVNPAKLKNTEKGNFGNPPQPARNATSNVNRKGKPLRADTTKNAASQTNSLAEQQKAQDRTKKPLTDEAFAMEAAQAGFMFIKFGKLAKLYGGSVNVRSYGGKTVTAYISANQKLKELMLANEMVFPDSLCEQCKRKYTVLSLLLGEKFDATYISLMLSEYDKLMALFKTEAKNGDNQVVRSWAKSMLPALKHQQLTAKTLKNEIGRKTYDVTGY